MPDDSIKIHRVVLLGSEVPLEEAERLARIVAKYNSVFEVNGQILFPEYEKDRETKTGGHWFSLMQFVERDELREMADSPIANWPQEQPNSEKETT